VQLRESPQRRLLRPAFLLVPLLLAAAGCQDGDRPTKVDLPSASTPSAAAASGTPTPSTDPVEQAVRAAYTEYWDVAVKVRDVPNNKLRAYLKDYFAEPYLTEEIRAVILQRVKKLESYGRIIPSITDVRVKGSRAVVRDCQDASSSGLRDPAHPSNNQKGTKRRGMVMTLVLGKDGRWRTVKLDSDPKACP
jgi:hypothetical protein